MTTTVTWTKKYGAPGVRMETDGDLFGEYEWHHDGRVSLKWGGLIGSASTEAEASAVVARYIEAVERMLDAPGGAR